MEAVRKLLARKNIVFSAKRYFIDAMGAMAQGLFCTLLVGTILNTLGQQLHIGFLTEVIVTLGKGEGAVTYTIGGLCSAMVGPGMAVAIGRALEAPPLVLFSLIPVGFATNFMGGAGGPLAVLFVAILASEIGKAVSKETKIDILVTPIVTVLSGIGIAALIAAPIGAAASAVGRFIMWATELQPFFMGIIVSVVIGVALTLPISSAAICAALGLTGLAGGAAGQTRQTQGRADGGGGDGQGQGHADDHGHDDAHEEGLQLRGPHDEPAHGAGRRADGGGDQGGDADAGEHRDDGRYQNVDLRLLADGLADLAGQNRHKQHRQRPSGPAHEVGGEAHGDQGEQHQGRGLQRPADGHRHARAHHGRAQAADGVGHGALALAQGDDDLRQESDVQLLAQGVENGAHQQGAEQALGHSAHGVDEIPLGREDDVLPGQELANCFHSFDLAYVKRMMCRCLDTCTSFYHDFFVCQPGFYSARKPS